MRDFHRNVAALTGLRGVAALWVAIFHFTVSRAGYQPATQFGLMNLIGHGYLAVDVFFVMSGFVMALSYAHYFKDGLARSRFSIFMVRRMARIYPLYLAVTLLYVAEAIYRGGWAPWLAARKIEFIANILMVQSWGISRSIVDQGWSISTEFAAYILFPFIAAALIFSAPRKAAICAALCAVGILMVAQAPTPPDTVPSGLLDIHTDYSFYAVLRCLSGFCLGMITYRVATIAHRHGYQIPPLGCYAIALALLLTQMTPGWDLLSFAITPAFILAVLSDNLISRLLGSAVIVFLGEISYAVYLIHGKIFPKLHSLVETQVLSLPHGLNVDLVSGASYIAITISVATLAHFLYERPARRWLRALEAWFDPRANQVVRASEARGLSDIAPR